jgi:hypothetical protein
MRNINLTIITLLASVQFAFSQQLKIPADHVNGSHFTKTIEYNTSSGLRLIDGNGNESPSYNTFGKSRLEKMFFGNVNAPVEYIFSPSYEVGEPAAAIRIVKDSSSNAPWMLEVKYITNWWEVLRNLEKKYPLRGLTIEEISTISHAEQEQIAASNREMTRKSSEERYELYEVKTLTFPLYHIGDRLCEKMTALVVSFRAEGGQAIIGDGYTATFRCVIGDEVWTLSIHEPQRRALQMSNLCRQIIEDAMEGSEFDEWKYVRMLEPIEF